LTCDEVKEEHKNTDIFFLPPPRLFFSFVAVLTCFASIQEDSKGNFPALLYKKHCLSPEEGTANGIYNSIV